VGRGAVTEEDRIEIQIEAVSALVVLVCRAVSRQQQRCYRYFAEVRGADFLG
jgi:hypothetical protein